MKSIRVLTVLLLGVTTAFQFALSDPGSGPDAMAAMDKLFRELRTAPAARRTEIIDAISPLQKTGISENGSVLLSYGLNPENRAVLADAIPVLIETLDGTVAAKAWWILISIQGSCPEPKKEVWRRWWKETGQKRYTTGTTIK